MLDLQAKPLVGPCSPTIHLAGYWYDTTKQGPLLYLTELAQLDHALSCPPSPKLSKAWMSPGGSLHARRSLNGSAINLLLPAPLSSSSSGSSPKGGSLRDSSDSYDSTLPSTSLPPEVPPSPSIDAAFGDWSFKSAGPLSLPGSPTRSEQIRGDAQAQKRFPSPVNGAEIQLGAERPKSITGDMFVRRARRSLNFPVV